MCAATYLSDLARSALLGRGGGCALLTRLLGGRLGDTRIKCQLHDTHVYDTDHGAGSKLASRSRCTIASVVAAGMRLETARRAW